MKRFADLSEIRLELSLDVSAASAPRASWLGWWWCTPAGLARF